MKKVITSEQAMTDFGIQFAQQLRGGDVIALSGDLGAGKTTLAKGIATGLGVTQPITSPTFVLMKVYSTKHPNIKRLVHIDCYRINQPSEMTGIGLDEYLHADDTLTIIEWPERITTLLPKQTRHLQIGIQGEKRTIEY